MLRKILRWTWFSLAAVLLLAVVPNGAALCSKRFPFFKSRTVFRFQIGSWIVYGIMFFCRTLR